MAGVQHVPRRVVDVEQYAVDDPAGRLDVVRDVRLGVRLDVVPGVEPFAGRDRGEEVGVYQPQSRVGGQPGGRRQQVAAVPVDDLGQRLDDGHRGDPRVVECRPRGVAQAEAADHDLEAG